MEIRTSGSTRTGLLLVRTCLLCLAAQIAMPPIAAAQSNQAMTSQMLQLMDRQKEIALALSACPASVADKAAVYVLESSGYVKVRESQNGFTAIVQHALPISQDPQCMDPEGTRTFLPRYLKVAELRAQGKTPEEIKRFVADAFAKGIFQPATLPGTLDSEPCNTEPLTIGFFLCWPSKI